MEKVTLSVYNSRYMIPHVSDARAVEKSINAVIPDIKLFWNHQHQRWVVAQVMENPGGLLLPSFGSMPSATRPHTLYKIEDDKGNYRVPSDWDVRRAIQIGREGREAIEKGGDFLVDKVERAERLKKEEADNRLREHVKAIAPDMRRALRGDTFHGSVK